MSMTLISTLTVGSGGAASIDFTGIAGSYTDLMLIASTRNNNGAIARNMNLRVNASTSGYSELLFDSNGASASSASTSGSLINWSLAADSASTSNTFSNVLIYFPNYSGSANKQIFLESSSETNGSTSYNRTTAALWANTAAITNVTLLAESGTTFVQYSSASLYGITKGSGGGTAA